MSGIQGIWWWDVGSKGLGGSNSMALMVVKHIGSLLVSSFSWSMDFLGRCSMILMSINWLFLSWNFGFFSYSFMYSLSGPHCLAFQAFLWNLDRSLYETTVPQIYVPEQPTSCGQCQILRPAKISVRCSWTIVPVATECLHEWPWWNDGEKVA